MTFYEKLCPIRLTPSCFCIDAVTLAAPVSLCPNPAPENNQLAEQLELDSVGLGAQVGGQLEGGVVASGAARG